jgi:hypothetical protein
MHACPQYHRLVFIHGNSRIPLDQIAAKLLQSFNNALSSLVQRAFRSPAG